MRGNEGGREKEEKRREVRETSNETELVSNLLFMLYLLFAREFILIEIQNISEIKCILRMRYLNTRY